MAIRRTGSGPWISALPSSTSRTSVSKTEWPSLCLLREGDIDWKAVYKALADIGYKGTATLELSSGDLNYLKETSRRFDLILTGA